MSNNLQQVDALIQGNHDKNVRTLAEAQVATDWYVKVKVHNNTAWIANFYKRILAAAGTIEEEPKDVPAHSTGSGGKYDAPFGPYGVSVLLAYNSPHPDRRFALYFVMPYVGSNSCKCKIIDKDTKIDQTLFNSMDGSSVAATNQDMTVDGKKYNFTEVRPLLVTSTLIATKSLSENDLEALGNVFADVSNKEYELHMSVDIGALDNTLRWTILQMTL
ncbi:2602_t:CDS:2, partial [Funneliformis mosseae]